MSDIINNNYYYRFPLVAVILAIVSYATSFISYFTIDKENKKKANNIMYMIEFMLIGLMFLMMLITKYTSEYNIFSVIYSPLIYGLISIISFAVMITRLTDYENKYDEKDTAFKIITMITFIISLICIFLVLPRALLVEYGSGDNRIYDNHITRTIVDNIARIIE